MFHWQCRSTLHAEVSNMWLLLWVTSKAQKLLSSEELTSEKTLRCVSQDCEHHAHRYEPHPYMYILPRNVKGKRHGWLFKQAHFYSHLWSGLTLFCSSNYWIMAEKEAVAEVFMNRSPNWDPGDGSPATSFRSGSRFQMPQSFRGVGTRLLFWARKSPVEVHRGECSVLLAATICCLSESAGAKQALCALGSLAGLQGELPLVGMRKGPEPRCWVSPCAWRASCCSFERRGKKNIGSKFL